MRKATSLAIIVIGITVLLVIVGTLWPGPTAVHWAGGASLLPAPKTPQVAVENLGKLIQRRDWAGAYSRLNNKAEFTESQFREDLTGYYLGLRSYASVANVEVHPLHATATAATVQLKLHWATVVGPSIDTRKVQVIKVDNRWQPVWPLTPKPHVPPQVISTTFLRWNVIFRGPGDDWGVQNVEAPHITIVDMHPMQRAEGVVVMGEILNTDVVPAYVSVAATLIGKNGKAIATEDAFDKISHILLPKQVTPFLIDFPDASLDEVDSIRMDPVSSLISASADPVVGLENLRLNPMPDPSLTGVAVNQSGEVVNIAHILGTFYDKNGQLVWVADEYVSRALLPDTPASFTIQLPQDLAPKISSDRAVVASYSVGSRI